MTKTVLWKEDLQNVVRSSFVLIIRKKTADFAHIFSYRKISANLNFCLKARRIKGCGFLLPQKDSKINFSFEGNNPMVGATVATAVAVEKAMK